MQRFAAIPVLILSAEAAVCRIEQNVVPLNAANVVVGLKRWLVSSEV